MTPYQEAQLKEIQERHRIVDGSGVCSLSDDEIAHEDRATLLQIVDSLTVRVETLEKALGPFADVSKQLDKFYADIGKPEDARKSFPDEARIVLLSAADGLRIKHLRAASSALSHDPSVGVSND